CGTGNTGVASAMGILGATYLSIVLLGGLIVKTPPPGWLPPHIKQLQTNTNKKGENDISKMVSDIVHVDDAMKTPQFWFQFVTFLATATVGMGLMSQAKDVLQACFINSKSAENIITLLGGPAAFSLA